MRKMLPLLVVILFFGCSSLPKNVTQDEYNSVRDYISRDISGMTYLELLKRRDMENGFFNLPYQNQAPRSNFMEYDDYLMEISSKMSELTSEYSRTDQVESFYTWAIREYRNNIK